MPEEQTQPLTITPADMVNRDSDLNKKILKGGPLVLTATLKPIAGLDRFQPAGFPEIGHVIYDAPRKNGRPEKVCIVDSPASMANHLESVCMRGPHDLELDDDLAGVPYLRCVTDDPETKARTLHATSLSEGHRIASTYFLGVRNKQTRKWDGKSGQRVINDSNISTSDFGSELANEFGIKPTVKPDDLQKSAHPPAEKWWDVFKTIFKYDPNALVHGVLFPQYQIKIARFLTAHLEAFGAARVDRSGVKFDRLGKTNSGQPIFAVDDETASKIRATFILDVAFLRSFGHTEKKDGANGEKVRGLSEKQKEFVAALALWKIARLLNTPFRYRSGCHLELVSLKHGDQNVKLDVNMKDAVKSAAFRAKDDQAPIVTDVYWPHDELYREPEDNKTTPSATESGASDGNDDEDGDDEGE